MKTKIILAAITLALVCARSHAQVNSGSNGSDGALNVTNGDLIINMADHPNGIYQYTYVNIGPYNVFFVPNPNNTPVVWLVQSNVVITGQVFVRGQPAGPTTGGAGGPGGYRGGNPGSNPTGGEGPGGGGVGLNSGGNGSYGGLGATNTDGAVGAIYGNQFLMPLVGGSGGGGRNLGGGGGGGGAILIVSSGTVQVDGEIDAAGGSGYATFGPGTGGGGSGGAVRIVADNIIGGGSVRCDGGVSFDNLGHQVAGGLGRVRFDAYDNGFGGQTVGIFSSGFQPIIIPTSGQGIQLTITSIGGVSVSPTPTGQVVTPDAVLSAQQNNPIPVVVSCANLPLHTLITVSVKPANGSPVSATGYNDTGMQTSSTATISVNIPRAGGIIYATATTSN